MGNTNKKRPPTFPRKICERDGCDNLIPYATACGRYRSKSKYYRVKFCSEHCKRLVHAQNQKQELELVERQFTMMDRFIYGMLDSKGDHELV